MSLLSFNNTPEECMMADDLIQSEIAGRLRYFPVVERPTEDWMHGEGTITKKLLDDFMPPAHQPDSHVMICGDSKFRTKAIEELKALGFSDE
jgi:NAD(P)H-flavin reductase